MTGALRMHQDAPVSRYRAAGALLLVLAIATTASILPGWTGIASILWAALAIAFHRWPSAGITLLAFAIPLQERVAIETVVSDTSITRYIAWALIVSCIPMLVGGRRLVMDRVAFSNMIIVIALVASFAAGGVRVLTWFMEVYQWLLPLVIYIICRSLPLSAKERIWIVAGAAAGVVVASMAGIQQAITGAGPESFNVGGMVRVFGTFRHPNTLASYLVLALPLMAAISILPHRVGAKLTIWIVRGCTALGAVALVLTQSRGGWLAFGMAMVFLVAMAPRSLQRLVVASGLTVLLLAVAAGLATDVPGASRFAAIAGFESGRVQVTPETWGQLERLAHWGAAVSMMEEKPLFGVGAAEFNDNYREHTPEWRFRVGRGHAHSGYLHMGAQAGVPGLIAFTIWLGTILIVLARQISRTTGLRYALAVGAAASTIGYAAHSAFEYLGVLSLPALLSIAVALALSDDRVKADQTSPGSTVLMTEAPP